MHVTNRAISNAGFTSYERLKDIVHEDKWTWPQEWENTFPALTLFSVPGFNSQSDDKLAWRCSDGSIHDFSVSVVWNSIRKTEDEVIWHKLVWSSYGIPRHSILLWLVMRNRLRTQDRLRQWEVGDSVDLNSLTCFLCKLQQDSREHLFFECPYSKQVWKQVLEYAKLSFNGSDWSSILSWAIPATQENKIVSIVVRMVLAASTYYIWQERNNRLYGSKERKPEVLVKVIVETIRLKLASIKFKKKWRVQETMKLWKIAWTT